MTRRAAVCAIAIGPLLAHPISGAEEAPEYRVKAAYLFNFLKFVDWPQARAGDAPWVIGILGRDPFGGMLDKMVRGRQVRGRAVEIRRSTGRKDVRECDILFIPRTELARIRVPAAPGLLTVGEVPGFLSSGGIVNFYTDGGNVHFEVRLEGARTAHLRMSSQMLKLGRTL